MPGILAYGAAGALGGLGEGMAAAGKAKREAAMRMLELQFRSAEAERRDDRLMGRLERRDELLAEREEARDARTAAREEARDERLSGRQEAAEERRLGREGGMLSGFVRGEDGEIIGVTKGGAVKRLGIKGRLKGESASAADDSGISAADERLLKRVEAQYSSGLDGEVDSAAVAEHLRQSGREDLAKLYEPAGAARAEEEAAAKDSEVAESRVRKRMGLKDYIPFVEPSEGEIEDERRKVARERKGGKTETAANDDEPEKGGAQAAERDAAATGAKFASAEEVKAAFRAGEISREEALRLLRTRFGMQ